jgi:AraC-like DNA-binding protein
MIGFNNGMDELSFSLSEIFSLIGLVQAVAVIVYILFRAGHVRHVVVPVLCFLVLGCAFFFDLGQSRLSADISLYPFLQNGFWLALPAFSVLMILQVADFGAFPKPFYWLNLSIPFLAVLGGWSGAFLLGGEENCGVWQICAVDLRMQAIQTLGILSGLMCFLALWISRGTFEPLKSETETRQERYWLIISFVVINVLILFVTFLRVSDAIAEPVFVLARDVLGGGMAYVASTSLFRIYPPSIKLERRIDVEDVNEQEKEMIVFLKKLFDMDKVYQETSFSRMELAKELGTSEARVSRLVGICFGKSLPQVINERRVQDSLLLLEQTDAQINIVAEQVGFNSVPTFNRVFKDIVGVSPSEYRAQQKKAS